MPGRATHPLGPSLLVHRPANARGTKSLYRVGIKLNSSTGAVENDVQEMVPDVENMQIDYLTRNRDNDNVLATDWVAASAFTGGMDEHDCRGRRRAGETDPAQH